jgi:hypothetical protein
MLPASPTPGSQAIHTGYRAMTVLTLWRQLSTWGSQECELGSRLVDAGPCHLRHRLMGRSGLPSGTRAGAPSAGRGEWVRLQRDAGEWVRLRRDGEPGRPQRAERNASMMPRSWPAKEKVQSPPVATSPPGRAANRAPRCGHAGIPAGEMVRSVTRMARNGISCGTGEPMIVAFLSLRLVTPVAPAR